MSSEENNTNEDLKAGIDIPEQLESYCVACGENGVTSLLTRTIPFFRDVILAAFYCPHCGFRSSDLQSMSFSERGCRFELSVTDSEDFDREVIRTEYATVSIPELDFEVPANTGRKGDINTVEGIVRSIAEQLEELQPLRRIQQPEVAAQLDAFIEKVKNLLERKTPFTLIIDDPSGNSFVQNPQAPKPDPKIKSSVYVRSKEQNEFLGINIGEELEAAGTQEPAQNTQKKEAKQSIPKASNLIDAASYAAMESRAMKVASEDDIVEIPEECPMCHKKNSSLRMITADIPLFKEIVLMAYTCTDCGYRNTEVKSGGIISKTGRIHKLKVTRIEDLSRDVLKSDTAFMIIPELDFEVTVGSLGGVFTTVEGIILKARDHLAGRSFSTGDSGDAEKKKEFEEFLSKLEKFSRLELGPFTLIINDCLANSYIQDLYHPEPDPYLLVEDYERTHEQNEELGLLDMKVDGYDEEQPSSSSSNENESKDEKSE
ncbi:putative zinc finger protein [Monocercomonoides exilis]|uniref:putative zinc finger protein n=1 Tax=Monocercomonoides exilis TaxID=2049356 RepID=UPI00355A3E38|nr:putative zinc finger protein [Monocercomonoides exilis]|eukprot:MONOS_2577.1-p1 / transcript=MONOS_2577.1 / gene=MONOS_2577 / organism=Monocercomonoides_exilis_PA203 / gene_product=zinc finger protein 259 / transcript_product=zinc finger protein 259 / location=Mono_scaffold00054:36333-38663(-) / protein_length=486 / sequence_SO=supercontig / SO=protein_coding / is_pseudo=false